MAKKYQNYLLKLMEETDILQRIDDNRKRLSKYRDSILFDSEVHNYKDPRYAVDKLARELLRLTPFGHSDFSLLERVTKRNMRRVVYDGIHKRNTKPHKNRTLDAALRREFNKLKSKSRADKRHKLNEIEMMIKENEIELLGEEFEIKLIDAIYAAKTPKTDHIYKEKMSAHIKLIQDYEARGEQVLADEIKSKPPVREPIFKEVAQSIKKEYLQKNNGLARRKLDKELTSRTRGIKAFAYPALEDRYPKE